MFSQKTKKKIQSEKEKFLRIKNPVKASAAMMVLYPYLIRGGALSVRTSSQVMPPKFGRQWHKNPFPSGEFAQVPPFWQTFPTLRHSASTRHEFPSSEK